MLLSFAENRVFPLSLCSGQASAAKHEKPQNKGLNSTACGKACGYHHICLAGPGPGRKDKTQDYEVEAHRRG